MVKIDIEKVAVKGPLLSFKMIEDQLTDEQYCDACLKLVAAFKEKWVNRYGEIRAPRNFSSDVSQEKKL